jgi:hypothetical protein
VDNYSGFLAISENYQGNHRIADIILISKPAFLARKIWRCSMNVSKAVNLFLDYHKMNSQKKYGQGLRLAPGQIPGSFS